MQTKRCLKPSSGQGWNTNENRKGKGMPLFLPRAIERIFLVFLGEVNRYVLDLVGPVYWPQLILTGDPREEAVSGWSLCQGLLGSLVNPLHPFFSGFMGSVSRPIICILMSSQVVLMLPVCSHFLRSPACTSGLFRHLFGKWCSIETRLLVFYTLESGGPHSTTGEECHIPR